jgi:hypothetical protein
MADRSPNDPRQDPLETARDVTDTTSPRSQGDGMETDAATSNPAGERPDQRADQRADQSAGADERGRDQEGDREGRGGYGNDTGFVGGTVGSRDDA